MEDELSPARLLHALSPLSEDLIQQLDENWQQEKQLNAYEFLVKKGQKESKF